MDEPLLASLRSNEKSLVYFYSPHCGPCRAMTPIIESLARERENVFKFDVSRETKVAHQFQVMATPTVMIVTPRSIERVILGPMTGVRLRQLLS